MSHGWPMAPQRVNSRAGSKAMSRDYRRHGTTRRGSPALNVATGEVLADSRERNAHRDSLAFKRLIDLHAPKALACTVLENRR